jgi:hypothetical protein
MKLRKTKILESILGEQLSKEFVRIIEEYEISSKDYSTIISCLNKYYREGAKNNISSTPSIGTPSIGA